MPADAAMQMFFSEVAEFMQAHFSMDRAEAVARVNGFWGDVAFSPYPDLVCHESSEYWAYSIVYGDVPFWDDTADRTSWQARAAPPTDSPAWTLPGAGSN
ncbi:hypothetical protein [Kitasatospora sp. McL0602]|uniref:hypothetical protein n=1 Tax=Kitasatospora sp. McL0602 TaxID=3439530 RepID=UPI003F8C67F0